MKPNFPMYGFMGDFYGNPVTPKNRLVAVAIKPGAQSSNVLQAFQGDVAGN